MLRELALASLLAPLALGGCRTLIPGDPGDSGDGGGPGPTADLTARPADLSQPPPPVDLTMPPPPPPDLSRPPRFDLSIPPPGDLGLRDLVYVTPVDASGFACGPQTCNVGQKCCIAQSSGGPTFSCQTSCPDGGVAQLGCDGPGTCGGNPCCVEGGRNGFGGVTCKAQPTDCVPSLNLQSMQITTRLCHADGDCTAGGVQTLLSQCCTLNAMGFTGHVCLNAQFAGFIGGTCP